MISFRILQVERQIFHSCNVFCNIGQSELNQLFTFYSDFILNIYQFTPFPFLILTSRLSIGNFFLSRIQNILSQHILYIAKTLGLSDARYSGLWHHDLMGRWDQTRAMLCWDCKKKPDYPAVDGWSPGVTSVVSDWAPSWIASIPNKYNPWMFCLCILSEIHIWYSLDHGNGMDQLVSFPTSLRLILNQSRIKET